MPRLTCAYSFGKVSACDARDLLAERAAAKKTAPKLLSTDERLRLLKPIDGFTELAERFAAARTASGGESTAEAGCSATGGETGTKCAEEKRQTGLISSTDRTNERTQEALSIRRPATQREHNHL